MRSVIQGHVLTLILDRPARRNAINAAMREQLFTQLDAAASDPAVAAVVLTGAGGNFCAGADLGSFEELDDMRAYRHVSHRLTGLMDAVQRLEKPVIAALDGIATGAGLTLALCCDWRIATPDARLLFREGRLALIPTHGGVARLVKLIGLARATQALLGGEDLDARAAAALGLVNEISDGEPLDAARARAERMLERSPLSSARPSGCCTSRPTPTFTMQCSPRAWRRARCSGPRITVRDWPPCATAASRPSWGANGDSDRAGRRQSDDRLRRVACAHSCSRR